MKQHGDTASRQWGSPLLRTAVPGLVCAAVILFFHPGAHDQDRIKWSLLLVSLLPLLVLSLRKGLLLSALAPLSPALLAAAAIPVFFFISCFRSDQPSVEEARLTVGILLLVTAAVTVRDGAWERLFLIPSILMGAGAIAAVYAVAQTAGCEPFYLDNANHEAVSTLGNTNAAAEVFSLLIPLGAASLFLPGRIVRILGTVSLPLLAAGLYATGGRGGLIAALAGLAVLFLAIRSAPCLADHSPLKTGRGRKTAVLVIALIGGGVLAAALVRTDGKAPFKNIDTDVSIVSTDYPTTKIRLLMWGSTLAMISDHPILGTGPGRFRFAFPPYRDPEEAAIRGLQGSITEVEDPHNEFLWAAAEGGVGAALALLLCLLLLLRQSIVSSRFVPTRQGEDGRSADADVGRGRAALACGIAGQIAAFSVLCLVRSPLHNPSSAMIFFLAAGTIEAWRLDGGIAPAADRKILLTTCFGSALLAALCYTGQAAFRADLLYAGAGYEIGTRENFSSLEEKHSCWLSVKDHLHEAAALDDGDIDMLNFTGQFVALFSRTPFDIDGRCTEEAEEVLGQVVSRHPNHPLALRTLARFKLLEGDHKAARRMLTRSLELSGSKQTMENLAVEILEQAGRLTDAARFLADTWSDEPSKLLKHAESLFDAGQAASAALYADAFLMQFPLHVDGLHLLARCLRERGDGGEKDVFRLMQLAISIEWLERGDWEQARRSARRSLRYGEGDNAADLILAVADAAEGEPFSPPDATIRTEAVLDRLERIGSDPRLPEDVRLYLTKIKAP